MADHHAINFYWLLRLRWGAVIGQIVVILVTYAIMRLRLPLPGLVALVGVSVAINLAGAFWVKRSGGVPPWAVPFLIAIDVLLLTGLLYFTGGPNNPFSSLYVVHIALAAVVLPPLQTWGVVGLALGCLGALFFGHRPLAIPPEADLFGERGQLGGAWVSFLVASVFIVYFVQRVAGALKAREAELARARELTVRSEKLASLATLSAGAAHELSTPLSTIAVVAKELERLLVTQHAPQHAVDDAKLIREQVQRCRTILSQMAVDAGDASGERARRIGAEALVDLALEGLPDPERVSRTVAPGVCHRDALLPVRAISQALRSLLKNALQASSARVHIHVRVDRKGEHWLIEIRDRGTGMSEQVLARAGDPFFTTKPPGAGMGLGLFLTRAVLERFGGQLHLSSRLGKGTNARVVLPLSADLEPLHVPQAPVPPGSEALVEGPRP